MIIGIVGPTHCGKNELVQFLCKEFEFSHLNLGPCGFSSTTELLEHVMPQWKKHFVVTGLDRTQDWQVLRKRPFFLLVALDAPLSMRFHRYQKTHSDGLDLNEFIEKDDLLLYGMCHSKESKEKTIGGMVSHLPHLPLSHIMSGADVHITNASQSLKEFHEFLFQVDLLNHERLRPSWDTYFMKLCDLAASRSNCMKRRVGCIVVKNKRIISTGYNGTPRGLKNCNEGGCLRCNSATPCGTALELCLCLHAEEVHSKKHS